MKNILISMHVLVLQGHLLNFSFISIPKKVQHTFVTLEKFYIECKKCAFWFHSLKFIPSRQCYKFSIKWIITSWAYVKWNRYFSSLKKEKKGQKWRNYK